MRAPAPIFFCEPGEFLVPHPKEVSCPNWISHFSPAGAGKALGWGGSPGCEGHSPAFLPAEV